MTYVHPLPCTNTFVVGAMEWLRGWMYQRDTVEADRGLGSRAERVRCFELKFVPNIFCPEISLIEALG